MAHSLIGGSSAARILACPGSLALYRKHQPANQANIYTVEGSMLHKAFEHAIEAGRPPELGFSYEEDGHVATLTQELLEDKLKPALDMFDGYLATLEKEHEDQVEFWCEQEVRFDGVAGLEEGFGTADVIGRVGNVGIVADLKFGDGVMVEAKDNSQLKFYAAAAIYTGSLAKWLGTLEGFELAIIQPSRGREVSRDYVSIDELLTFASVYRDAVQHPDPPLALGSHCRFCAVKLACPLQAGGLAELALPFDLTPERLAQRLELANVVEDLIGELRKTAHEYLSSGRDLPGFKLVPKRASRKWADLAAAEKWLRKQKLKVLQILPRDLISPAQAEKLLKGRGVELPADLITTVSTGTTIATIDDPRPAVPNVAAFAAIAARVSSK